MNFIPSLNTRTALSSLALVCLALTGVSANAQLTNGLVGLWSFNGDTKDSSGNGNDATLENGASLDADTPADLGGGESLRIGGGTQHALVPDSDSLDLTDEITIAAWVKPAGSGWGAILAKSPSDGGGANHSGNYELRMQNNANQTPQWLYETGPGINSTVTLNVVGAGPTVGEWNHIALTMDNAGNYTYFLNGVSTSTAAGAPFGTLTNDNPLYIGTRADLFTTIDGHLDEVALWNRALTPEEVAQVASGPVFGGPVISLSSLQFTSAISQGGLVSTLSSFDPTISDDTYTYALAAGDGDTDNGKFQIAGDELQAGTHNFSADADGTTYTVRLQTTGTPSGETGEASFILSLNADSDADDLPDEFELQFAADLGVLSGLADANADGDGLTDLEEFNLQGQFPGLDPTLADTDGDTLNDDAEIDGAGARPPTDPINADTDGDTLNDGVESNTGIFVDANDTGTDPTVGDTDGDGTDDGAELAAGTNPTDPNSFPPVQLVGLWRFEGNAEDSSGLENHGDFVDGASLSNDVPAALGGGESLSLTGGGQHVLVPDAPSLTLESEITIAAWVKPAGSGWGAILAKNPSDGGLANHAGNYELRTQNNANQTLQWLYETGPGLNSTVTLNAGGTGPVVGEWAHVAVTHDKDGNYTYYMNGDVISSAVAGSPFGTLTNSNPLYLGSRADLFTTLNGNLDDVALFSGALGEAQIEAIMDGDFGAYGVGSSKMQLDIDRVGGDLVIKWPSEFGMLYILRSSTDPEADGDPGSWEIFGGHQDLEATPDINTLTIPLPADPVRFFVIEAFPKPPLTLLAEDFEAGAPEWTVGSDGAVGTVWGIGPPTGVSGPIDANMGLACYGTNLNGDYEPGADVWLRSPAVDLSAAGGATLSFAQFRDIDDLGDNFASVSVLNAADDSFLAAIVTGLNGFPFVWEDESFPVPAAALGQNVKFEFRLVTDEFAAAFFGGYYIDDVLLTTP